MRIIDVIKILFFTLIFSFLIFIAKNYFFGGKENFELQIIEEKYIEPIAKNIPVVTEDVNQGDLASIPEMTGGNIKYSFVPKSFGSEFEIEEYRLVLNDFLNFSVINNKLTALDIMLYKYKGEVRGKMQNKKVKLFGIYEMELEEFLAVGIHEFAHFYDLYVFKKINGVDDSNKFYNISWEDVSILKSGLQQIDFVSGYSMTNQYEDFAESFTYYVLHNSDFKEKVQKSSYLKLKYDFFKEYVFNNQEFTELSINVEEKIKDYYRDITKIKYGLEKFLQYLKK